MSIEAILEDQIIHVKRGRTNQLGFEPAWNSYFELYMHSKYFDPPLIEMQDMTLHLFLRKNLNDKNPQWKMPSFRQMRTHFGVSQRKIDPIMQRLSAAHLLTKVSGLHKGADRANITNHYVLSDPIPTREEFLVVATAGGFGRDVKQEWAVDLNDDTLYAKSVQGEGDPVREMHTAPICNLHTDQQTLTTNQTGDDEANATLWQHVMWALKPNVPAATFHAFMQDMRLLSFEDGNVVLGTPRAWVREWVEVQMKNRIRKAIEVELRILKDDRKVETVRVEIVSD